MSKQDSLFLLIKSLTKSEKRYFKMTVSLQQGDKNYLQLFDVMEAQASYNEKQIRLHFKGQRFLKQLHVQKNYLYNLIFKSLRNYNEKKSIDNKLSGSLLDIGVLFDKALFNEAKSMLYKTKKLAYKHEKYRILIDLLAIESQFGYRPDDEIYIEREKVMETINRVSQLEKDNKRIFEIYRKFGMQVDQGQGKVVLNQVFGDAIAKIKYNSLYSTREKILYNVIYGNYLRMTGLVEESLKYWKLAYGFFESNPLLLKDKGRINLCGSILGNLHSSYLMRNKIDQATPYFKKLISLSHNSNYFILVNVIPCYVNVLHGYNSIGAYNDALKQYNLVESIFEKFDLSKAPLPIITPLYYNMSIVYFGLKQYKNALLWLGKLLNVTELSEREDIHCMARIYNLILYYEMGNIEIEYLLRNSKRFLSKRNRLRDFEKLMISFFKKNISAKIDKKEMSVLFDKLKTDIDLKLTIETKKIISEYFDIYAWLNSKINHSTFAEEVVKNAKKGDQV